MSKYRKVKIVSVLLSGGQEGCIVPPPPKKRDKGLKLLVLQSAQIERFVVFAVSPTLRDVPKTKIQL